MMNMKYILRLGKSISLDRYLKRVHEVHVRSGKPSPIIFLDMLWCMARYGAGYTDFVLCGFEDLKAWQRDTYLTRVRNKKLSEKLNDREYTYIFNDKHEFYAKFKDFLGRDFLCLNSCTDDEIWEFASGKSYIIAKPSDGEGGKGIQKIKLRLFRNKKELCAYLRSPKQGFGTIEDLLTQHEALNTLYPCSVNCIRFLTLVHNGKPHILYAVLKAGNNGSFLDNYSNGGFSCHIDCQKAELSGPGHSETDTIEEVHPYTGKKFKGLKLPYFEEAMEMVKKAALVVPQVKFVGWDVCIGPEGPSIVEGNDYPGDFSQVHDEGRERIGILKKIREIGVGI